MKTFQDRRHAGRELGERLGRLGLGDNVLVIGLAGGGATVAEEVARCLGAGLDVMVVRELQTPFRPKRLVGAVAPGGVTVYEERALNELHLTERDIEPQRLRELVEIARQERDFGLGVRATDVAGSTIVLVDDGIETGAALYAAVLALRELAPSRIIGAVPTSARDEISRLEDVADRMVALATPQPYPGIEAFYAAAEPVARPYGGFALAMAASGRAATSRVRAAADPRATLRPPSGVLQSARLAQ
jgi:predicted phosphoribosyltransferase